MLLTPTTTRLSTITHASNLLRNFSSRAAPLFPSHTSLPLTLQRFNNCPSSRTVVTSLTPKLGSQEATSFNNRFSLYFKPLPAISRSQQKPSCLISSKAFTTVTCRHSHPLPRTRLPTTISVSGRTLPRRYILLNQLRANSTYRDGRRRRPFSSLGMTVLVTSALAFIPVVFIFGAPAAIFAIVPIVAGGVVASSLLLAGGILFVLLPIIVAGGALVVGTFSIPAAVTFKDLDKILKRNNNGEYSTALSTLGSEWEIQPSRADEWFRWTFPKNAGLMDKASIRMAIFDSEDDMDRKKTTSQLLDSIALENGSGLERVDDNRENTWVETTKNPSRPSNLEISDNSSWLSVNNLSIKRERDHLLIQLEDYGDKLLEQRWAKKYLQLGQIVDRAATEMEMTTGTKMGEQVVLVRRKNKSFWSKFMWCGDVTLRVPFDRTWIHDVSE